MKTLRQHLETVRGLKKEHYHPIIHKIHKKHRISKKTLFYIKEYGPKANVPSTIVKESAKILLLASLISSFGGLALEHIKTIFVSVLPLVILLPALNDMIGDYGTILSSRFSTMLYEGKIKKNVWANKELKKMFSQIFAVSLLTTVFSAAVAVVISMFSGYAVDPSVIFKIFLISILDVTLIVIILILISVFAGLYFFKKKEDPNNFLIPITTSVADFGNMIILSILIMLFF